MLLYSTLLCEKIARAPGGHKKFMLTKLGGGGGQNRIDPRSDPSILKAYTHVQVDKVILVEHRSSEFFQFWLLRGQYQ